MNASTAYANGYQTRWNQVGVEQAYQADTSEGTPADDEVMGSDAPMVDAAPATMGGIMGQPATWWVMLLVVTAIFIFISRKFGGTEKFGNIKLTLWNGLFSVAWYILVLNFLKVVFSYVRIPGWSDLVKAA